MRGQTRNLEPQTQNPGTPTPPDTLDPEARNTHPIAGRLLFFEPDGLDLGLLRWPPCCGFVAPFLRSLACRPSPPSPVCSCRDRMLRSPSLDFLILAVIRSRCTPGARPSHPGMFVLVCIPGFGISPVLGARRLQPGCQLPDPRASLGSRFMSLPCSIRMPWRPWSHQCRVAWQVRAAETPPWSVW